MRQVEYSFALCKNTWVYSPTGGGPTAFSIQLDQSLADMGKQGWECCGWVPDRDGMMKMVLKRYVPASRRHSSGVPLSEKISPRSSHATNPQRARRA